MNPKHIFAFLALIAYMTIAGCKNNTDNKTQTADEAAKTVSTVNEKPIYERPLKFTYRAQCQMLCHRFPEGTKIIKKAIKDGQYKTSEKWSKKKPCPLYLVSYKIDSASTMQLALAACPKFTKVAFIKVKYQDPAKEKKCNCSSGPQADTPPDAKNS
jgi:hypothetical protein